MKTINPLVGKKLLKVLVNEHRTAVRFVTEEEEILVRCDADCCSSTWVEHIDLPSLPAVVTAVEDIDMPNLGNVPGKYHTDVDQVAYYGCKITTDKGVLLIDYRNDSNGYYGGNLSWPDDPYYYGGVHDQQRWDSDTKWTEAQ